MNYDTKKYKVLKLPNLLLLYWILNPGLAFNEIILGQRLPKVTKTSNALLMERQYVPCPTCGKINDARLWSTRNTFGHWFGIICPKCENKILCLWNITSLAVLTITFPIWFFVKKYYEKKWLKKEKSRLVDAQVMGFSSARET
jgi:hypothetical protein